MFKVWINGIIQHLVFMWEQTALIGYSLILRISSWQVWLMQTLCPSYLYIRIFDFSNSFFPDTSPSLAITSNSITVQSNNEKYYCGFNSYLGIALYGKFKWRQWVLWDQVNRRLFSLVVRKILLGKDLDKKSQAKQILKT